MLVKVLLSNNKILIEIENIDLNHLYNGPI